MRTESRAGWLWRGVVASQEAREASGGFRLTTNNRMEIFAPCGPLNVEAARARSPFTAIRSIWAAIMKGWAVAWKKKDWWLNNKERAKNIDLWQKLLAAVRDASGGIPLGQGPRRYSGKRTVRSTFDDRLQPAQSPGGRGLRKQAESDGVRPALQAGEPCRKCSTPVIKQRRARSRSTFSTTSITSGVPSAKPLHG